MITLFTRFRRFFHSEQGAVLPIIGLSLLMLITFVAVAIDMGRIYMIRTKVNSALDAAVLAAANAVSGMPTTTAANKAAIDSTVDKVSRQYFAANLPSGYMGITYDQSQPNVHYSPETQAATGNAAVNMPMVFGAFTNVATFGAQSNNTVQREESGLAIEVSLALDITSSMCKPQNSADENPPAQCNDPDGAVRLNKMNSCMVDSNNRYNAMLTAVRGFMDQLNDISVSSTSGSQGTALNIYVGASFFDSETLSTTGLVADSLWETGHENILNHYTDIIPPAYRYEINMIPRAIGLHPVAQAKDDFNARLVSTMASNLANYGRNTVTQCSSETQGEMAAVAADYMLSPVRGFTFDHITLPTDPLYSKGGRPAPFGDPKTIKIAIILTDGSNMHYIGSPPTISVEPDTGADADMVRRCEGLKAAKVLVYTIAYGQPVVPRAENTLRACASGVNGAGYYFEAANSGQLANAFQDIADSVSDLRITK